MSMEKKSEGYNIREVNPGLLEKISGGDGGSNGDCGIGHHEYDRNNAIKEKWNINSRVEYHKYVCTRCGKIVCVRVDYDRNEWRQVSESEYDNPVF